MPRCHFEVRHDAVAARCMHADDPAVPAGKFQDERLLLNSPASTWEEPAFVEGVLIDAAGTASLDGVFDEERQVVSVLNHGGGREVD